jgi:hypothetical protein
MTTNLKSLSGYFGKCGYETNHEFVLNILPFMRKDVLASVTVIRWQDGMPVVKSTFKDLGGLNDWCADMYGYCFDVLWDEIN